MWKKKSQSRKTSWKCSFQKITHQLEVPLHTLTGRSSLKQRRLDQQRQFTDCKKKSLAEKLWFFDNFRGWACCPGLPYNFSIGRIIFFLSVSCFMLQCILLLHVSLYLLWSCKSYTVVPVKTMATCICRKTPIWNGFLDEACMATLKVYALETSYLDVVTCV